MKRWDMKLLQMMRPLLGIGMLLGAGGIAAAEWVSLETTTPDELFGEKCGMCHRAGGMGTGILGRRMTPELALLENRTDLQGPFIETVVRSGFGIMFPISRGEVSDAQLQQIIEHLTTKERAP